MYLDIHKSTEERMKKTVKVYKDELKSIRAGRANPALLDRIVVDYYGTPTPLKQISNVSAPEPRSLLIQPWDANSIPNIEKAILTSELGLNPSNDGKLIRLSVPQLTEERRKDIIKLLKKVTEESKVAVRNARRDANEHLKKIEKTGEITEDDLRLAEEQVQKLTDKYIEEIEKIKEHKAEEIMEV